jgi:site-specific DNA-methyltransferase (adenine-specific)
MLGDCLERMKEIPDGSVDMVLTDPPYGTTACKWDTVIDLPLMWEQLKRVIKPNGAIVMTASQPFTSALVMSNPKMFKYEWIWGKNLPTGFATAGFMPMKSHENVCVFVQSGKPQFNKQPTKSLISDRAFGGKQKRHIGKKDGAYGSLSNTNDIAIKKYVSPRSLLQLPCVPRAKGSLHPTQKPVALMEYLIRTYTNPGETVLDFTMGSGTTGCAAANTSRKFIGIELDQGYFDIAEKRIQEAKDKRESQLF